MARSQTLNIEVLAESILVDCKICDRFFRRRRDRSSNVVAVTVRRVAYQITNTTTGTYSNSIQSVFNTHFIVIILYSLFGTGKKALDVNDKERDLARDNVSNSFKTLSIFDHLLVAHP